METGHFVYLASAQGVNGKVCSQSTLTGPALSGSLVKKGKAMVTV